MLISPKRTPYLSLSLLLHVSVLTFLYYFNHLSHLLGFDSHKEIIKISRTIQVDVVEMPKMSLTELKNLPSLTQESEDQNIEKDEDVFIKKISLKNRLKALANKRIKTKKRYQSKKVKKQVIDQSKLKDLVLAGNKVVEGTSHVDDTSSSKGELDSYLSGLIEKVRTQWKLPSYLKEQNLKCRVKIFLSSKGKLLKVMIVESSGHKDFDQRAIAAIKKTSPFGEVAKDIRKSLSRGDIVLGFPL